MGFPGSSVINNLPANGGDMGLIPESGGFSGQGNSKPFPVFLPGNPMDRGAWRATVHGVTKESDTTPRLNNCNKILPNISRLPKELQ